MTYQKVEGRILKHEKDGDTQSVKRTMPTEDRQRGYRMWVTGVLEEETQNKGRGKILKAII